MSVLLKCDRCDAVSTSDLTGFVSVDEHDTEATFHYCGWDCLLKAAATIDIPEEFDA